ncbi:universal stress protein [Arundinibacter roseus]|uniref:Universal stress protein n=1 Tax=Arundinibacter roseus TaxID=2070510 RepID=A0A4R4KEK4_9BACT|nr:universal stress protein [Arundinibacter roseus]TDB65206.1 universal stress protein [Arundinibacter roseus]
MKKILVLTDYSAAARHALLFAMHMYHAQACEFSLLHSYAQLPEASDFLDDQIGRDAQAMMNDYVEGFKKEYELNPYHALSGTAIGGNIYIAVSELYAKQPSELVVVGATGNGDSIWLGSVATEIIRTAPCPVLVVPISAALRPLQDFVIATDYSNFKSQTLFKPVAEVLEAGKSKLVFLSILEPEQSAKEVDQERQALLNQYFEDFEPLHFFMKDDSTLEGIEEYLSNHHTDLLVTVSHNRSLWDVLLNRSTSRILAYQAEVPLLVLTENVSDSSEELPSSEWELL